MLEDSLPQEGHESIGEIRRTARRLANLSEKAEQMEETLSREVDDAQPDVIDAGAVVRTLVDEFRAARAGATIDAEVESAEVAVIDAGLFEVAVRNLIENAVEHTQRDPRLEVSVRAGDPVEISVADNGPGIPSMELQVLSDGGESPLQHSSGMGLWLVKWIATSSGGGISFETNAPRGTVVTLTVPAAGGRSRSA
ncbi:MAG: sensor histidine kinase [Salinirussus sp.]